MKNGGAAFPLAVESPPYHVTDGMTLRDYFAGQALTGYMVTGTDCIMPQPKDIAEYIYKVADAMLAEREKENA